MILKQIKMPYEKAILRLHHYPKRRRKPFAVVMETPERTEYFLSYHETQYKAEKALSEALNTKNWLNFYPSILDFVEDYLSKSKLAITREMLIKDIKSLGLNYKVALKDDNLKADLRKRYAHLK